MRAGWRIGRVGGWFWRFGFTVTLGDRRGFYVGLPFVGYGARSRMSEYARGFGWLGWFS